MINTILFDLDGTLLPLNHNKFGKAYFRGIWRHGPIKNPIKLYKALKESILYEIHDKSGKTNEEAFYEKFKEITGINPVDIEGIMDEYYETQFDKCRKHSSVSKEIKEAVKLLKQKGYLLVLATNPIFPQKAIHKRIKWADFSPDEFAHITSFEKGLYCKPQIEFFIDILKTINKTPEECMMVGNDMQDDMVAGKLGIATYLITDYLIDKSAVKYTPDYKGNAFDFLEFAKEMPDLTDFKDSKAH